MPEHPPEPTEGIDFVIGDGVRRAPEVRPYQLQPGDPRVRPLRIYAVDAAASRLSGAVARVQVPYEPLEPGPTGSLFEVDSHDGWQNQDYRRVDLEDPAILIRGGLEPTPSDPRFHQQMVYAVATRVYATFQHALGRDPAWGFDRRAGEEQARLCLRPFAFQAENAEYSQDKGAVSFGYYTAPDDVQGRNKPGGFVFTALSHDIIVHEVSHALLDGLRARFLVPTGPDVLAFHESFADLIAIFQHFTYRDLVLDAIRRSRGDLQQAELLTDVARQFGHTTGQDGALRSAVGELTLYDSSLEPHALGQVLTQAVFDAYLTVFQRKTVRYVRLATGGSGVLPPGELAPDLQNVLADQASRLARQFLRILIRAVDYCPPVDLEYGHFLRAVISADRDLVGSDPWGYREAWIDAFARRRIYPRSATTLSEESLVWGAADPRLPPVAELGFDQLRFDGDPGRPADLAELERQARALGRYVTQPELRSAFGLLPVGHGVSPACMHSIRSSRRVGPDGQVIFDLVAEVTQSRVVDSPDGRYELHGGATIILGPYGEIRYVIHRSLGRDDRRQSQHQYMTGVGRHFWRSQGGHLTPVERPFRLLHQHR